MPPRKEVPDDLQILGIYRIAAMVDRSPRSVKFLIKSRKLVAWRNGSRYETTVQNVRNYIRTLQKGTP